MQDIKKPFEPNTLRGRAITTSNGDGGSWDLLKQIVQNTSQTNTLLKQNFNPPTSTGSNNRTKVESGNKALDALELSNRTRQAIHQAEALDKKDKEDRKKDSYLSIAKEAIPNKSRSDIGNTMISALTGGLINPAISQTFGLDKMVGRLRDKWTKPKRRQISLTGEESEEEGTEQARSSENRTASAKRKAKEDPVIKRLDTIIKLLGGNKPEKVKIPAEKEKKGLWALLKGLLGSLWSGFKSAVSAAWKGLTTLVGSILSTLGSIAAVLGVGRIGRGLLDLIGGRRGRGARAGRGRAGRAGGGTSGNNRSTTARNSTRGGAGTTPRGNRNNRDRARTSTRGSRGRTPPVGTPPATNTNSTRRCPRTGRFIGTNPASRTGRAAGAGARAGAVGGGWIGPAMVVGLGAYDMYSNYQEAETAEERTDAITGGAGAIGGGLAGWKVGGAAMAKVALPLLAIPGIGKLLYGISVFGGALGGSFLGAEFGERIASWGTDLWRQNRNNTPNNTLNLTPLEGGFTSGFSLSDAAMPSLTLSGITDTSTSNLMSEINALSHLQTLDLYSAEEIHANTDVLLNINQKLEQILGTDMFNPNTSNFNITGQQQPPVVYNNFTLTAPPDENTFSLGANVGVQSGFRF